MKKSILFVNGVPSIEKGAGLFSIQLDEDIKNYNNISCLFVSNRIVIGKHFKDNNIFKVLTAFLQHCYYRLRFFIFLTTYWVKKPDVLIILHQQYVGFKQCEKIIKSRNKDTFIYLLDSGFFCIKSYNHLEKDNSECIKCVGGNYESINIHGCNPFPVKSKDFRHFLVNLHKYVGQNKISFLTQNNKQADLVKLHYGEDVNVKTVGIWTSKLPDMNSYKKLREEIVVKDYILYHGTPIAAKGVTYSLALAKLCPDINFVFPFDKSIINDSRIPNNCEFHPINWDTGLKELTINSKLVLVPSLWSAPIESALVKSLIYSNAVCVVEIDYAFSSEIENDIILKLSKNLTEAAKQIKTAYFESWRVDNIKLANWYDNHLKFNKPFVKNIYEFVNNE